MGVSEFVDLWTAMGLPQAQPIPTQMVRKVRPFEREDNSEEMEKRMRAGEVEISGIAVPFRHRDWMQRNLCPGQVHAGQMDLFDALPAPESMQAIFEPVMIPGHDQEQDEAGREDQIAEERPA